MGIVSRYALGRMLNEPFNLMHAVDTRKLVVGIQKRLKRVTSRANLVETFYEKLHVENVTHQFVNEFGLYLPLSRMCKELDSHTFHCGHPKLDRCAGSREYEHPHDTSLLMRRLFY